MPDEPLDIRLTESAAQVICDAYSDYRSHFDEITGRAGGRFWGRDWQGARADRTERLDLYKQTVDGLEAEIRRRLHERIEDKRVWARIKAIYAGLIGHRGDQELAGTFFNSLTRRIFVTIGVDPQVEFISREFQGRPVESDADLCRRHQNFSSAVELVRSILMATELAGGFDSLEAEAALAAAQVDKAVAGIGIGIDEFDARVVASVFYRGKGAFVIGCLTADGICLPLVFALLNTPGGIIVDGVLTDEDDVSVLFSFARSYFHVAVNSPGELVGFLKTILPKKRVAELYIALGFHKHGKTEFYRELLEHLDTCGLERFEISAGTPGMVMVVFNMPGYDLVFKLIRDRFGAAKQTTRSDVIEKYAMVFKHDRVGRLVDAQSFEYLQFETCCFSEALLEEFRAHTKGSVQIGRDDLIIDHAYVQRRVTPLDIFLQQAQTADALKVVIDLGHAIKDLALSNIFAGDFLLKNFGVTRHGRVVFYDYDEICPLTQCEFKKLPPPQSHEDELSAEPWFLVGENDVFPEEFRRFLPLPPHLMTEFSRHHADLFEVEFWRNAQQAVNTGQLADIIPYPPTRRLKR